LSLIYRILRRAYARAPFDGEGAYRYGGRWSSPGTRLAYTSEHQSLAMLEYFVHLDKEDPPLDLVFAIAEVPDDVAQERVTVDDLPEDWREPTAPPDLARLGDEFVQRGEYCVLIVPSALAPAENNWLINAGHPDHKKIDIHEVAPLNYDPRMFAKKTGHGRRKRFQKRH
jgi:RES domain-containing protein